MKLYVLTIFFLWTNYTNASELRRKAQSNLLESAYDEADLQLIGQKNFDDSFKAALQQQPEEVLPEIRRTVKSFQAPIIGTVKKIIVNSPIENEGKEKRNEPHHWSALENYYQKLRQSSAAILESQKQLKTSYDFPLYDIYHHIRHEPQIQIQQQEQEIDGSLQTSNRPITYHFPTYHTSSVPLKNSHILPLVDGTTLATADKVVQVPVQHYGFSLPNLSNVKLSYPAEEYKVNLNAGISGGTSMSQLNWQLVSEQLQRMYFQEQQQRAKYQQELLYPSYDQQKWLEYYLEESFCGPRNYISPTALLSSSGRFESSHRLETNNYPSHAGIYLETLDTDNFLCGSSWIDERFMLTLASCVMGRDPEKLLVRAGEWYMDKNQGASLITRKVSEVIVFHGYKNTSQEHNLALLKLISPINYVNSNYLMPACQTHARSTLSANSCWTPVRNVTLEEYFDASGEGETRERKIVGMMEKEVKLISHGEIDCNRATGIELFHSKHLNFICSGDIKRANWRIQLNNTDSLGSGIYCEEGKRLSLVSIIQPIKASDPSAFGYLDLTFYKPWMRSVISSRPI